MERGGHKRFARAGGGIQDDVLLIIQLQNGGLLRGIELEPPALDVFKEAAYSVEFKDEVCASYIAAIPRIRRGRSALAGTREATVKKVSSDMTSERSSSSMSFWSNAV